ncbi:unnamed protein product, partial [Discosporangium mesarthrocarpum]
ALPHLDGKHVVFGEVESGIPTLDRIKSVKIEGKRLDGRPAPENRVVVADCGELNDADPRSPFEPTGKSDHVLLPPMKPLDDNKRGHGPTGGVETGAGKEVGGGTSGALAMSPHGWLNCSNCSVSNPLNADKCMSREIVQPEREGREGTGVSGGTIATTRAPGALITGASGCFKRVVSTWAGKSSSEALHSDPIWKEKERPGPVRAGGGEERSIFASLIKNQSRGWKCGVDLVSSPMDKVKCMSCETVKPGEEGKVVSVNASGGSSTSKA